MHPEDLSLEEPGPVIVICTETEKAGNSILLGYMNKVCFGFNPENKALQLSAGDSIFGLNYRILYVHNLVSEIVQIFQAGILKCYQFSCLNVSSLSVQICVLNFPLPFNLLYLIRHANIQPHTKLFHNNAKRLVQIGEVDE